LDSDAVLAERGTHVSEHVDRRVKLRLAGVPVTTVRYDGTCHDFMLLNALSQTRATRAAISQATAFLREALRTT
jgi:acetyl esterase/lipase